MHTYIIDYEMKATYSGYTFRTGVDTGSHISKHVILAN
jgi:hypothetical protein